ncbi:MAG: helix-turn-helix transcriptional regulator [Acidimicrobiia bacterium]
MSGFQFRSDDPISRSALGAAIHACADGVVTRRHLSEALGVSISAVNSWAAGSRAPSLEDISRFEEVCHRPRGWVLARAGYAPGGVDTDLEDALRNDPNLSPEWREILGDAYAQASGSSAPNVPRVRRRRRMIDVDPGALVADPDAEGFESDSAPAT